MDRCLIVLFTPAEAAQAAGFAQALAIPCDALNLTGICERFGADKMFNASLVDLPPADGLAKGIAEFAGGYTHVASVASMMSKDVMARVAGILDAAMVTDAIGVDSPSQYRRPMVAGSIVATVETLCEPVVVTFRPSGFAEQENASTATSEPVTLNVDSKVRILAETARGGKRPDLTQAKVVVTGGRPLKDAATFENVIGGLADVLGGAVGATRAAVDSGIAANELQVGQTGKIVAPELYIAAGVSGSTQHMAGIKDSKIIVAVNKDPGAPIFESADYGLVADLFEALPEMREKLTRQS